MFVFLHRDMLLCMLQAWFVFDKQLTINTPLHKFYLVNNQIFLIYESSIVQFMYQLHLHNALKWFPSKDLGFM